MQTKKVETLLNSKNIGLTSMRMLVLDAFLKQNSALSLSDLEELLPQSDRSTLYRTLKTFEKKGLIHSVQENNTTQYLLCKNECDDEHHHDYHLHFHCTQCNTTVCLEEVNVDHIQFPKDYDIQELKFVANGICKNCMEKVL